MTKQDLLARAKTLGISGRHDMTKEQLEAAVAEKEVSMEKIVKVRITKNSNLPWRRKYYYVDVERFEASQEALKKAPMQVQLMMNYFVKAGHIEPELSETGPTLANKAINAGVLKTRINGDVLFAYYRSLMETLGLVFAGYNLDGNPR